jgi:hypothetical protein
VSENDVGGGMMRFSCSCGATVLRNTNAGECSFSFGDCRTRGPGEIKKREIKDVMTTC